MVTIELEVEQPRDETGLVSHPVRAALQVLLIGPMTPRVLQVHTCSCRLPYKLCNVTIHVIGLVTSG